MIVIVFPVSGPLGGLLIAALLFRILAQICWNVASGDGITVAKFVRTLTDVDFGWNYVVAPWQIGSKGGNSNIEYVECVFESGPAFVVQMSVFLYVQYLPNGFDAITLFLLSTGVSVLDCVDKYYSFAKRQRAAGPCLAIFTAMDVYVLCMTHALFAYKLSTLLVPDLGRNNADGALALSVVVTVIGWWSFNAFLAKRTKNIHANVHNDDSLVSQSFALVFFSIPLFLKISTRHHLVHLLLTLPYHVVIGALYAFSSNSNAVESAIGGSVLSLSIARVGWLCLLSVHSNAAIYHDEDSYWHDVGDNTLVAGAVLRLFLTIIGIAASVGIGFSLQYVLDSHLGSLNCDSLAHSQLPGLLGVNSISTVTLSDTCQPCVMTGLSSIALFVYSGSSQDNLAVSNQYVAFGARECPWSVSVANIKLPALTLLSGLFDISSNSALTILSIPELSYVGGGFSLSSNPQLTHIDLSLLQFVGSDSIFQYGTLNSLELPLLSTVGGSIEVSNSILPSLHLPSLTGIGDRFSISSNGAIIVLNIPNLTKVGGDVFISANYALASIAFPVLAYVGGSITISSNDIIASMSAAMLTYISASLAIVSNMNLLFIDFTVMSFLGGDMLLQFNQRVQAFSAPSLSFVGQSVSISSNPVITSVSFPFLEYIGKGIVLDFSPMITTLNFLHVSFVGGDISVNAASQLTLVTVPNLTLTTGSLVNITSCPALHSIIIPSTYPSVAIVDCPVIDLSLGNVVTGNVIFSGSILAPSIGGSMHAFIPDLRLLNWSGLTDVVGNLSITNHVFITSIVIVQLQALQGQLLFHNVPLLSYVSMSQLHYVGGSLNLAGNLLGLTALEIPLLQIVNGSITLATSTTELVVDSEGNVNQTSFVDSVALTIFSLPHLSLCGSVRATYTTALLSIELRKLMIVNVDFDIQMSGQLSTILLPSLTFVGNKFMIEGNTLLSYCSVPSLMSADTLLLWENAAYATYELNAVAFSSNFQMSFSGDKFLSLTRLTYLQGDLTIQKWTQLTLVLLPVLTRVDYILEIEGCDSLTIFSLPLMTYTGFSFGITDNALLTTISLPVIAFVGGYFVIERNAKLSILSMQAPTRAGTPILCNNGAFFRIPTCLQPYYGLCAQGSADCPAFPNFDHCQ